MQTIYVVSNIVDGYPVIAYLTYVEARVWVQRHPTPANYSIDRVSVMLGGQ